MAATQAWPWVKFETVDQLSTFCRPAGGKAMKAQSARVVSLGRLAAVTGRERGIALATAVGALAGGRQRAHRTLRERFPTVAVTGMTGVGKTALVLSLIHI